VERITGHRLALYISNEIQTCSPRRLGIGQQKNRRAGLLRRGSLLFIAVDGREIS